MKISERIEGTIENWRTKWGNILKGWMASWFEWGIERLFDAFEPDLRSEIKPSLLRLREMEGMPDDIKAIIDKATTETSFIQIAAILPYLVGILIGLGMGAASPMSRIGSYQIDNLVKSARLDPFLAIRAYWRGFITEDKLKKTLSDLGWSEDDIKTLRDVTHFYPAPADLIMWQAREVFEPEMITRYGLDSEYELIEKDAFYKAGMTDEQIKNYWRAHWEHASWMQVVQMLRRGQLTEDEVWDWFRVVEIPPFWRDKLIHISYAVPTRVDVRRFWDMRTIDEKRLREIYAWQGYHGKDLDDYILWTKVYVAFPDLIARWKNGWISEDDVRSELAALGMLPDRVEEMIQTKIKTTQPERVIKERDLTKAEIIKGVKKEVISRSEGTELLQDMGYDEEEAEFMLEINVPVEETVTETKRRELTKTDILKGLKAEIITEPEALSDLIELRYIPDDAEFLLKILKATAKPPVEPGLREASKADITSGVKKGLITPEEGYMMLLDIGFSPEASHFILAVKAEVSPFSPNTYGEFKKLIGSYRIVQGLKAVEIPPELINAEKALKVAEIMVKVAEEKEGKGKADPSLYKAVSDATYRYKQLLAQWKAKKG